MINIKRVWNAIAIQKMCIENDFYTLGDNEEYNNLFDHIAHNEPTPENIRIAAEDIVKHSDLDSYEQSRIENVETVMFLIEKTVNTFYKLGK